ncbi:putative membrane protein, partial [Vibrio parahaemolyticus V-223/04]
AKQFQYLLSRPC